MNIKLIDKKLSQNKEIAYLTFELEDSFNFKAGQFVIFDNWKLKRAYSMANSPYFKNSKISFYVKKASENWFSAYLIEKISIWEKLEMTWPFWNMFVKEYSKEKIYLLISAWSWLWPILWIYEDLIYNWIYNKIYNFYQERYFENIVEDVYKKMISFEKDNVKNFFFLSKWKQKWFKTWYLQWDLSKILKSIENKDNIEVYLCWSPYFVDDIEKLLRENWVKNIYFEKY